MSEHTPGPWRVDETVALGAYGVWTDYGMRKGDDGHDYPGQICSVYANNRSDFSRDVRDANARLIAAAPDLLEACEAALDQLEWYLKDHAGDDQYAARIDQLQAAINSAKPNPKG